MTTDGGGWTLGVNSLADSEAPDTDMLINNLGAGVGQNTGHTRNLSALAVYADAEIRHFIQDNTGGKLFHAKYTGRYHIALPLFSTWTVLGSHLSGSESLLAYHFGRAWSTAAQDVDTCSCNCAQDYGVPWYHGSCWSVVPACKFNDGGLNGPVVSVVSEPVRVIQRYSIWVRETAVYNAAPVLDNTRPPLLNAVSASAGVPSGSVGTPITSLVDIGGPLSNVTDANSSPVTGVAIIAAGAASGTWYFTTDNGVNWALLGTPDITSSRLLAAASNNRVFFQPTSGFSGTVSAALTFRAWDQTTGANGGTGNTATSGGTTAFSSSTDTADIDVLAAPTVVTQAAGAISGSGATLHASVNPNGFSTSVSFEYSTASDLSGATTTAEQNIGGGSSAVAVDQSSSGLTSGTTYYFRASATSAGGTAHGTILSFTASLLVANDAVFARASGLSLKVKVTDVATEQNNYPLTVTALGPSVNNGTLSTDHTYIYYAPATGNNDNDSFPYTVDNGHGSTDSGTITVTVAATGGVAKTIVVSGNTATIKFFGIPGIQYDVQRTTSLTEQVNWVTLTTDSPLSPGTDGSFTFTDDAAPNGTAYYRSVQH